MHNMHNGVTMPNGITDGVGMEPELEGGKILLTSNGVTMPNGVAMEPDGKAEGKFLLTH